MKKWNDEHAGNLDSLLQSFQLDLCLQEALEIGRGGKEYSMNGVGAIGKIIKKTHHPRMASHTIQLNTLRLY